MGHSEVVFGPVGCCVAGTRPHGPGNQGGPVGTCWARCLRARLGGARSPASPSPTKQTRSIFRARVEALSPAQPHHAQFGGEHASPLGAGGPDATPTAPHMGTGFASCVGVGTRVECLIGLLANRGEYGVQTANPVHYLGGHILGQHVHST